MRNGTVTELKKTTLPGEETLVFTLEGLSPLLMHNERLANPMSPESKRMKALTGKRKKTDEDLEDIARAEFDGGLYIDEDGPFIPASWIVGMLRDGGRLHKLGKTIQETVICNPDRFTLDYPGRDKAKTADELWSRGCFDQRMVKNQKNKVLRTRPRFDGWQVMAEVTFQTAALDRRQIEDVLKVAGVRVGLGDYRPRYGRFQVLF